MELYLFLLLATELLILIFACVVSGCHLASPTIISCTVFMVATLCVIFNIDFWDVNYSAKAYGVTSFGLCSMLAGESIARFLTLRFGEHRKQRPRNCGFVKQLDTIDIPQEIGFFLIFFDVVCTMYVVYSVISSGSASAGLSVIGEVKYSEDGGLNVVAKLAYRYTWLLFIVYAFIFFKNMVANNRETRGRYVFYLLPLPLVCISTFFIGNRANLLKIICSCYVFWVLAHEFTGQRLKVRTIFTKMLPAFVALLVVFYATREITKIGSTTGTRTFIDYITYYIGSPVYLFSSYLENPLSVHPSPQRFGELTFEGLYNFFGVEVVGQAYTLVGGQSGFAGNVYSWLCRPYNDFGLIGALIFTAVVYGIFSYVLYGALASKTDSDRRNCTAIIFVYFYYVVFFSFYYCQICWAVTPTNLVYCLALVILYKVTQSKVPIVDNLKFLRSVNGTR